MRSMDSGNVPKDLHIAFHRTVHYVSENFGREFLSELMPQKSVPPHNAAIENTTTDDTTISDNQGAGNAS